MVLLTASSGLNIGDMIVQLFFFVILLLVITGITSFVVLFNKRGKQLDRIEEKLNQMSDRGQ
ncbi:hypothetical protein SAMN05216353_15816 [Halobacillus alkaliphilus]|uniref:DUF4083 domain-containing protein n=1 Tax=Halobacillus alkaliphilus TaxID=396056 RepID=A0A1I2T0H8_9BACI|nr:hypothetical protein [Halobacillus alkaliphilus]SFG57639.1 hypothetical protein SAMN05216353_15816 [Halobacillus alkaliphilus]